MRDEDLEGHMRAAAARPAAGPGGDLKAFPILLGGCISAPVNLLK